MGTREVAKGGAGTDTGGLEEGAKIGAGGLGEDKKRLLRLGVED